MLVPVWIWHTNNLAFNSKKSEVAAKDRRAESAASDLNNMGENVGAALSEIGNPLDRIDENLVGQFSQPVSVTSTQTKDGALLVYFQVANNTLADLIVPTSLASLRSGQGDGEILLEKVTNSDGQPLPPLVAAGKTQDGILYFSQVLNGSYELKFTGLRYQSGDENEFEQVINLEVKDSWQPRS